jgi:nitrate reductase cytochrome c-type subunit
MKVLKSVLAVGLAIATCGAAMAATGGAGILGTRHDFATRTNFLGSQSISPGVANKVGQCAFCHTPHSAQSTLLLWNKAPSVNVFDWADASATTGGTLFTAMDGATYKGPTAKCLACHDGSVAIGDVSMYKGAVNAKANSFKVGQQPTDYTGKTWASTDAKPQYRVGLGGNLAGTHPVGVPYPDVVGAVYNTSVVGGDVILGEFQPLAVAHQVSNASLGGGTSVSTQAPVANGLGNQNSLIRLYVDNGQNIVSGAEVGISGIECSSCHDVHNKQTVDDWLLRGQNQGSTQAGGYICLQCHIK